MYKFYTYTFYMIGNIFFIGSALFYIMNAGVRQRAPTTTMSMDTWLACSLLIALNIYFSDLRLTFFRTTTTFFFSINTILTIKYLHVTYWSRVNILYMHYILYYLYVNSKSMVGVVIGISENGKHIPFSLSQTHLTPKWRLFRQLVIMLFDEQFPGENLYFEKSL